MGPPRQYQEMQFEPLFKIPVEYLLLLCRAV
jgi:hypothetical protein